MSVNVCVEIHGEINSQEVLKELTELMARYCRLSGGDLDWMETADVSDLVSHIEREASCGCCFYAYGVELDVFDDVMRFCEHNQLPYKRQWCKEDQNDFPYADYWRPGMEKRFEVFEQGDEPMVFIHQLVQAQADGDINEFIETFRWSTLSGDGDKKGITITEDALFFRPVAP